MISQVEFEEYGQDNQKGSWFDITNWLIELGISGGPSIWERAKGECCKSLDHLPGQELLSNEDAVLKHYGLQPTNKRWTRLETVLALCIGAVGIFYSPTLRSDWVN